MVPPEAALVTYTTGDKSELKPGTKIFIAAAKKLPDGSLEVPRINYGKDGLTPPDVYRSVIEEIDTLLFLVRQIEHWRLRALSDRDLPCKPGYGPAIRLRRCDDFDNSRRRATVALNCEIHALLHNYERLCGKMIPATGCRVRTHAIEHEQVAIRPARCGSGPLFAGRDTDLLGRHLARPSLGDRRTVDAARYVVHQQLRKGYNPPHTILLWSTTPQGVFALVAFNGIARSH
jgi:hypothetical protein